MHVAPYAGERKSAISCEGEHLSRGGGEVADSAAEGEGRDYAGQDRCSGVRLCGVVESADEGEDVFGF